MPRVLQIHNRLIVGGPSIIVTALTKYLSPEFETLMVVGEKEEQEQSAEHLAIELGIDYIKIPEMGRSVNPLKDLPAFGRLKKIIRDFRPDVVHTHAAKPGALGRLAAAACGVPAVVHTFHGHVFHSYFNKLKSSFYINAERYLAQKTSAIIAISDAQKKELVDEFHISSDAKVRVIPLGLDLDRFQQDMDKKRRRFRAEFGLDEDEIAIGIIGRLVPVKNHPLFLQAIQYVVQNSTRRIKAFVVGDGETRKQLENQALAMGLNFTTQNERSHPYPLIFTSWRYDVDVVNAGLDIVALTSFNEGTPVSLIEAQASNKPIVSAKVGGIGDIVQEGKTALLANVDDEELFCSHLLQVVEDDTLRAELGSNSRPYVMRQFNHQRMIQETANLYYELLRKKVTANVVFR